MCECSKVSDFEDMLNKVHSNLMEDHPFCGQDKWEVPSPHSTRDPEQLVCKEYHVKLNGRQT